MRRKLVVPCFPLHPLFVSINHSAAELSKNGQVLVHPLSRLVHPWPQLLLRFFVFYRFFAFLSLLPKSFRPLFRYFFAFRPLTPSSFRPRATSPLSAFLCGFTVLLRFTSPFFLLLLSCNFSPSPTWSPSGSSSPFVLRLVRSLPMLCRTVHGIFAETHLCF